MLEHGRAMLLEVFRHFRFDVGLGIWDHGLTHHDVPLPFVIQLPQHVCFLGWWAIPSYSISAEVAAQREEMIREEPRPLFKEQGIAQNRGCLQFPFLQAAKIFL